MNGGYQHQNYRPLAWNDAVVSAFAAGRPPGITPAPDAQLGTTGLWMPTLEDGKSQGLMVSLQLPHGYKPGGLLRFHVHYIPSTVDTGFINLRLAYQIASVHGAISLTTNQDAGADLRHAAPGAIQHHISTTHVVVPTGIKESACLIGKLYRLHDANDTFVGDVHFWSADLHLELEKPGTRNEWPS